MVVFQENEAIRNAEMSVYICTNRYKTMPHAIIQAVRPLTAPISSLVGDKDAFAIEIFLQDPFFLAPFSQKNNCAIVSLGFTAWHVRFGLGGNFNTRKEVRSMCCYLHPRVKNGAVMAALQTKVHSKMCYPL